jgi:hypothetical protein
MQPWWKTTGTAGSVRADFPERWRAKVAGLVPVSNACALARPSKVFYLAAMQAHRAETTLSEDGVLTLRDIPFRRGESVEVIVLPFATSAAPGSRYPLRGVPVRLVAPADPVADAEWEAAG